MNREELGREIFRVSHRFGEFKLRSGQISNEYFDKYQFESDPRLLKAIAKAMVPLLPRDVELLAGLEVGGIPIATALSLETGIPVVFVRKKAKEYGTCQFAEGPTIRGKKLCIIEDVITTGGQVFLSAEDLKKEGALIREVLCVIDRGLESQIKMEQKGLQLSPLFTMNELKG